MTPHTQGNWTVNGMTRFKWLEKKKTVINSCSFASIVLKDMFRYLNRNVASGEGERDGNKWDPGLFVGRGIPAASSVKPAAFQEEGPRAWDSEFHIWQNYYSEMTVKETLGVVHQQWILEHWEKKKKDTFPGNQSPESDCCRQTCLTRAEGGSPGWKGGVLDSTSGFCWNEGTSNRNYRKRSTNKWFCLETFWYQKWSSISAFPTMKTLHTNRSQK